MTPLFSIRDALVQWQIGQGHPGEDWMFTFIDNKSENLVIALGDSWTWGDSLKDRENQMYGKLLSDYYNADLINVGCPGWSNSWILLNGQVILSELKKNNQYKNIYVIATLTENARDLGSVKSFDFAYYAWENKLTLTKDLYQHVLDVIEDYWVDQLQSLISMSDDRFVFFVGQNFVWHKVYDNKIKQLPRTVTTDVNWIEVLADSQNLSRPIRTNLVTGHIFHTLDLINSDMSIKDTIYFKEFILPLMDKANLVNRWLDCSPMNYKKDSKHPNAAAHQLWADHIIEKISLYKEQL